MTNLQYLEAYNTPINSLSPVTGLTQLVEINADADQITAIPSGMSALTNLQDLELYANPITSLPNLSGCSSLQVLVLDSCQITNISPVTFISGLVVLTASSNPLNAVLPNLSSMVSLQYVDFSSCGLTNITGVSGMTGLETIGLGNNNINNIDPLVSAYNAGSFRTSANIELNGNPMVSANASSDWSFLTGHGVNMQGTQPVS
jgi:internalin A